MCEPTATPRALRHRGAVVVEWDFEHGLEKTALRLEAARHREIHTATSAQTRTVLFGVIGTVMATGGTILAGIALAA